MLPLAPSSFTYVLFPLSSLCPRRPSRLLGSALTSLWTGHNVKQRNIAQCFHPGDLSASAALAYAVHVLKVESIIVCGHTGCGGVRAGMQAALDQREKGDSLETPEPGSVADVISKWIAPVSRNIFSLSLRESFL